MPSNPQKGVAVGHVVKRQPKGSISVEEDYLSIEEPLEIRIRKQSLVVTMRTPGHDEELAAGFLYTEGILKERKDLKEISPCALAPQPENVLNVFFRPKFQIDLHPSTRYGTISSSCGICGKTSIEDITQHFPLIEDPPKIKAKILLNLPQKLSDQQKNFEQTGGLHAAALFDTEGNLIALREDVGRHNAVDKIIGYSFLNNLLPLNRHILMVSGRTSFEIMQKSLAAGIPILGAVSAPSSLAVAFARESRQTLIGFLRPPKFNVYSHPQNIEFEESSK